MLPCGRLSEQIEAQAVHQATHSIIQLFLIVGHVGYAYSLTSSQEVNLFPGGVACEFMLGEKLSDVDLEVNCQLAEG